MAELLCPESRVLLEFAAGGGEAEIRETVRAHLARCQRCRQTVAQSAEATISPGQVLADTVNDSVLVPGSDLGRDIAAAELAEQSTRLYQSPAELSSRFDLGLFEPSDQPGSLGRLGKCEVLDVIGFGGMGVVFRAQDQHLLRNVAIKVMARELATSDTARRRFIREARAAAAINHPNVVTIHSVEEHQGTPFLVMELLEGESLRDRLRHAPKLELLEILSIAAQIAAGLAAAHAHGVIHRDIKPGNIMLLDKLQRVKITDFGLARVAVDNSELTSGEVGIGTPTYMSPEQVKGGLIDARSDLFALGCVMYAMIRGHSPFHGTSALEIARKVVDGEPSPPVRDDQVPAFLGEIIERLLKKSPDERFQSAAEVGDLLRRHLATINLTPTDKLTELLRQPPPPVQRPRLSLGKWLLGSAAAVMLLGLAAFGGWRMNRRPAPSPLAIAAIAQHDALPEKLPPAPIEPQRTPQIHTVSSAGIADFQTLAGALATVRPGDTVQILDDAEYRETIMLNSAERFTGLTIAGNSEAPPTIVSPSAEVGPLQIRGVTGVTIRDLRLLQEKELQHVIIVSGVVSGTTLEHLAIDGVSATRTLIFIAGGRGTAEKPLVLRKSRVGGKFLGLVIQQAGDGAMPTNVDILDNLFETDGTQAQVNLAAEGVRFVGNVFHGGKGLSLGLPDPTSTRAITVASNTFFRCKVWLSLRNTSPDIAETFVVNNLILEQGRELLTLDEGRQSIENYAKTWTFVGNYCEISPPISPSLFGFARYLDRIEVRSRVADEPGYLLPKQPLEPADAPEGLPARVGANLVLEE